jgi:Histidine kinase/Histidine kinase-, DNA gyrase B-, and HSP90-like ATPase
MLGDIRLPNARGEDDYVRRVLRAFDRRRLGAVVLVTLLLSLGPLSSSDLLDFFSPAEIALLWLEHLAELAVLAATLTIAYTLLDEALWRQPTRLRLAIACAMLFALSAVLTVLLYGYYAHGFDHLPPLLRLVADSLRFGLPAIFLILIADVHRRALQVDSAARTAEISRVHLGQDESEQQLALLQAQIEPHFLFNVLGNVRRLYRTQPQVGSETIGSLMRYLRAALPQLRTQNTSLGSELELVRAYLDLLQVRMGARLTFSIEVDPTLHHVEFPPMLLITLVENAIKHGLEPVGGGNVSVRARCRSNALHITVLDNGVGLGAAASGGTGVGLANVRRQLVARYKSKARLTLEARTPRGTSATIVIPLSAPATAPDRDRRERAAA